MRLLESTLRRRRSAARKQRALNYARQIADALEAPHEKGITHRKPANVKGTPQGVVKVLDFGLAKIAEPVAGNPASSPTLTMRASEGGITAIRLPNV